MPPNNKEFAELCTRQLKWILYRIFLISKDSLVVVAGDFNKAGKQKSKFLVEKFGLTKLVPDGMATHNKGNELDGVWTNMQVARSPELI